MDCDQVSNSSILLSSDNYVLEEQNVVDDITKPMEEDLTHGMGGRKRGLDINNEEVWTTVTRKKSKSQEIISQEIPIQICVTSKEKLPRQFSLAKLLKQHEIPGITKVKYVNLYKLLITFVDEISAEKFLLSPGFDELGWRRQKTWEIGFSYGIIRNIDIDLSEEELQKHISSEKELVSVKRLNRKNPDGWTPSETVQLRFKGSALPSHIYLHELKVAVENYVFPVSQCSKCWRFGHSAKMCPSHKIICPKCTGNHANCDKTIFKCVNCYGKHMALSKICPAYKKEKRIRELMSEYNCTYQKAQTVYVPPSPRSEQFSEFSPEVVMTKETTTQNLNATGFNMNTPLYSDIVKTKPQTPTQVKSTSTNKKKQKKKQKTPIYLSENVIIDVEMSNSDESNEEYQERIYDHPNKASESIRGCANTIFQDLLNKLKCNIQENRKDIIEAIKTWFKIIVDWLASFIMDVMPDFGNIKSFFMSNYG